MENSFSNSPLIKGQFNTTFLTLIYVSLVKWIARAKIYFSLQVWRGVSFLQISRERSVICPKIILYPTYGIMWLILFSLAIFILTISTNLSLLFPRLSFTVKYKKFLLKPISWVEQISKIRILKPSFQFWKFFITYRTSYGSFVQL